MREINKNFNIELKEAIIKTVAFFDMFDCPLTVFEIWKYLPVKCELTAVISGLNELIPPAPSGKSLESKNGFYFLPGRNVLYDLRMARYNFSGRKFGLAMKIARIFKLVPWIRMIALSNVIGANNAKEGSDIDLFMVTEDKKIWLTRFFCLAILKFFGLRPTTAKQKDKICLSFFISQDAMNLKRLLLAPNHPVLPSGSGQSGDIYFIYWLACLVPIYDRERTYRRLLLSNDWFGPALPNWQMTVVSRWRDAGRPYSIFYRDLVDMVWGGLEGSFRREQLKRLPNRIKEMMNKDTRVVISDNIIKTHTNDRRQEYRERFWQNFGNK